MAGARAYTINEAMAAAVDELGAELMINMPALSPPGTPRDRIRARASRLHAIQAAGDNEDAWVEDGFPALVATPRVTVLWDRPSLPSARHRVALRGWMGLMGIDPADVGHVWAFPLHATVPPLEAQVEHYRESTLQTIKTIGAPYVLLVGDVVKQMWRRDLKLHQVAGALAVWGEWFVWPTQNPIQCIADPSLIAPIREGVVRFCEAVREGHGLMHLATGCVEVGCTGGVWVYDRDGVPWCKGHAKDGINKREVVVKNRNKRGNQRMQGSLL